MNAFLWTCFILNLLGLAAVLALLAMGRYPRERTPVNSWDDAAKAVGYMAFAAWSAWLLFK
jgi:hypothetical protein